MTPTRKQRPSSSRSNASETYVALLRGVNVGGKNKLSMSTLVAMFTEAGCTKTRTYIQSGNVVFSAPPVSAKRLPGLITERIADRLGLRVPVILRSAAELREAASRKPFHKSKVDENALFVGFLADLPEERRVAALDPQRSPGDSFRVLGREIYMSLTNGAAKTKLTTAYFDSNLATTSTFRNWRTVMRLLEMTQESDEPRP